LSQTEKAPDPDVNIDWYFTFGMGHPNAGRFVKINGTFQSAREEMMRRYGTKWSMQYDSEEKAGVKRWNYIELK